MLRKLFSPSDLEHISIEGVDFSIKHRRYKRMKRLRLHIEHKNELIISSSGVNKVELLSFIHQHKNWILERNKKTQDPYALGSEFYYLAQAFCIKHHEASLFLDEQQVYINPSSAKQQCDTFYKKMAKSYVPERLSFWEDKMGLKCTSFGFRLAKRRWGSCNAKGHISLNPYMMKLSYEMIDYILVHELAHLKHLNHSRQFYTLIKEYLPSHKAIESEIKAFTQRLY